MTKPQYAGRWRTVRKAVLARDGFTCQIATRGCTLRATQVDHIVPVSRDPKGHLWLDLDNLRAACANCNRARQRAKPLRPGRANAYPPQSHSRDW